MAAALVAEKVGVTMTAPAYTERCAHCGVHFQAVRSSNRYCSKACALEARRDHRCKRSREQSVERACAKLRAMAVYSPYQREIVDRLDRLASMLLEDKPR
jgi:hypothetical protein